MTRDRRAESRRPTSGCGAPPSGPVVIARGERRAPRLDGCGATPPTRRHCSRTASRWAPAPADRGPAWCGPEPASRVFPPSGMRVQCQRLQTIPGIGPVTATALIAAIGEATQFKNGRQLAAWLGLVPREHSTGGTPRLLGISKRGDRYLRKLLVHGARATLRWVATRSDDRSRWLKALIARRGKNRAAVALANKNARIAWALLAHNQEYRVRTVV